MQKMILMVVSILFSISVFTYESQALECTEPDTLKYDDGCTRTFVAYCYQVTENPYAIDINIERIWWEYYGNSEECYKGDYELAPWEWYEQFYWQTLDVYLNDILAEIFGRGQIDPILCESASYTILNFSTAYCQSRELIWVGSRRGANPWEIYDIFEHVPCSQNAKCLSIYNLCWKLGPDGLMLIPDKTLVSRIPNVNDACPETYLYSYPIPGAPEIEVECEIKCDE